MLLDIKLVREATGLAALCYRVLDTNLTCLSKVKRRRREMLSHTSPRCLQSGFKATDRK